MSRFEFFKNKTIPKALLTMAFLFFSQAVFSAGYTGIITKILKDETSLKVNVYVNSINQEITLVVDAAHDGKLFQRLKAADYISFQAQSTPVKKQYKLTSVDYVGLRDLLGVWNSSDCFCYNFTHFSELVVYPQDEDGVCYISGYPKLTGFPKTFKYFITANETGWDILVGSQDLNFSAEFYFQTSDEIFARIFNTDTGKVDSELMFWR